MRTQKKVIDCFSTPVKGIFYYLNSAGVPWVYDETEGTGINPELLDSEYLFNIAGDRYISPLIRYYLGDGETLTDEEAEQIARIITSVNGLRWRRLWESMELEYNPIENYNMHETMTDDATVTEYGHVNTHTPNTTETDVSEMQGFNSSEYKPTDRYTSSKTGTDTNTESGSDTRTRNYELTRTGNIGVTTSQQMIESERRLWVWDFFHDVVFPDINRFLALSVY